MMHASVMNQFQWLSFVYLQGNYSLFTSTTKSHTYSTYETWQGSNYMDWQMHFLNVKIGPFIPPKVNEISMPCPPVA